MDLHFDAAAGGDAVLFATTDGFVASAGAAGAVGAGGFGASALTVLAREEQGGVRAMDVGGSMGGSDVLCAADKENLLYLRRKTP